MTEDHKYKMTISLNVLNHLGIGLYSNIPAVLSEIVANAWDADATKVTIDIDMEKDEIVIIDNGRGMNREDINNKYLMIGYDKRKNEPGLTPLKRNPMGRKGIGKLSVFSIANTVEVYSIKNDERNALSMSGTAIKRHMELGNDDDYHPDAIDPNNVDLSVGTKIVLKELKRGISTTSAFLRRRLARRFSIIDPKQQFAVVIDGEEISAKDRDYHNYIEFLWYFGNERKDVLDKFANARQKIRLDNTVDEKLGYFVRGWIGTVDEQKHIDDQYNTIIIYAHGKLVQEDILTDFKEGGVYSKYLIGEIDADFLDLDKEDDIVTSNRQSVKEDDPRYQKLKEFIRTVLKTVQNEWTRLRNEIGAKRALENPTIKKWYERLHGDSRDYARRMFGKIESLNLPDIAAKRELYKASILAFERMDLKHKLSLIDSLETETDFATLASLFAGIDDIEAIHYYQITQGRVEIIRKFDSMIPEEKEKALQEYIYKHPWLLDPSWERATPNLKIEESVTKEFAKISNKLTEEEKRGRIDIRYTTSAGKHIIIELKKYDRRIQVTKLMEQVLKYRNALEKCLREKFDHDTPDIECICLLGNPPEPREREQANRIALAAYQIRYVTYDKLVDQALQNYREYLDKQTEMSELMELIYSLDETM